MSRECDKCGKHAVKCECNSFGGIIKNSPFYHYGILPEVCIHSTKEDEYSKMYSPREKCDCGSSEWIEGKMDIVQPVHGYKFPQKDVHRCKKCNEVRVADHIGIKNER